MRRIYFYFNPFDKFINSGAIADDISIMGVNKFRNQKLACIFIILGLFISCVDQITVNEIPFQLKKNWK